MRKLTTYITEEDAWALADYLVSAGIAAQAEQEDGAWVVWVMNEDQLGEARQKLAQYESSPNAPEVIAARGAREKWAQQEARRDEAHARRIITMQRDRQRQTPVTYGLIALSVLVFLAQQAKVGELVEPLFYAPLTGEKGTPFLRVWEHGQVWRLVTPIFLHFGFLHILFNMMWLQFFGMMIERKIGSRFLLGMALLLAVVSNTAQFMDAGPRFGGMSGVNYGLFGYIWIRSKLDPASGLYVDRTNTLMLLFWFVLCYLGSGGHVANAAHAGGLILGMLWGTFAGLRRRRPQ